MSLFLFCYLQLLSTDSIEHCFLQGAGECLLVLTSDVLFCCLEQKTLVREIVVLLRGTVMSLGCSIMVVNLFIWHAFSITLLDAEKHDKM